MKRRTTSSGSIPPTRTRRLCYADPKLTTDGVAPGRGHQRRPDPALLRLGAAPWLEEAFRPDFGFNYRINDKMVVRGGYGIFFDSFEGREIDDSADIYPYSVRNNLSPHRRQYAQAEQSALQALHHAWTDSRSRRCRSSRSLSRKIRSTLRPVLDAFGGAGTGAEHHAWKSTTSEPSQPICWTGAT
jgi:hypothetical protein